MKHILVVDDEDILRDFLSEELEDMGYRVSGARNGREALEAMGFERPDLVLCDNAMPVMSGLEFLKALRSGAMVTPPPVVMVSAFTSPADVAAAQEAGAVEHLSKPVDFNRLAQVISAHL